MPTPVPDADGVHCIDTELFGPGVMSAYAVRAGDEVALVDPGAAATVDAVRDALAALDVAPDDLRYLLPTHVHLDHAGATGALADAYPEATVVVHEAGLPYLTDPAAVERLAESARRALGEMAAAYGEPSVVPRDRCRAVSGGETLPLGDRTLDLVDAPGHAPHQYAVLADDGTLFAADAAGMFLGDRLYPTTPPPDFDLATSLDTVDRLRACEPERLCYGHFGHRGDAVAALDEYAELLPEWVAVVEDLAAEHDDAEGIAGALPPRWQSPTVARDVPGVLRYLDG